MLLCNRDIYDVYPKSIFAYGVSWIEISVTTDITMMTTLSACILDSERWIAVDAGPLMA